MTDLSEKTEQELRAEIEAHRAAIEELRADMASMSGLREQLPAIAAAAFAVGFAVSGGIGGTVRPIMRRRYRREAERSLQARLTAAILGP